jgi:hypothetical protein
MKYSWNMMKHDGLHRAGELFQNWFNIRAPFESPKTSKTQVMQLTIFQAIASKLVQLPVPPTHFDIFPYISIIFPMTRFPMTYLRIS